MKSMLHTLTGITLLSLFGTSQAQEPEWEPRAADPEIVFAYQGEAELSQLELDAAFNRIPESDRLSYIRDGRRVDQLVSNLLKVRLLAQDAIKAGFDQDPVIATRMRLAAERELVETWLDHIVASAPEANYEALAYENYLANPESYKPEEILDVSHILISSDERSAEEAEQLAISLREQLDARPDAFEELVLEYSDDPAKTSNRGRYSRVRRGQMVKSFEDAAFALETSGQITQPVKTNYGFHIIRLNRRISPAVPEFEEIKAEATRREREKYIVQYRSRYIQKLTTTPIVIPDGAVEIMAKRYFGENLELAPDYPE